jgi:flagellar biosynthesis/type III secretory pathway protein FliH
LKKLYQTSEYEDFVKEEIYMSSALYKEPYEKGREEGREEGLGLGETRALARTLTKLLVKKFGILTEDLKKGIQKLDATTLEILIDNMDGYSNLEDLKNYIQ